MSSRSIGWRSISRVGMTTLCSVSMLMSVQVHAQEEPVEAPSVSLENSLIQDWDGDGVTRVMAFGDSLTRGVGDFTAVGEVVEDTPDLFFPEASQEAGYPLRLERWTGVSVLNYGNPGEALVNGFGFVRFAESIQSARPDLVVFFEGANDAVFQQSATAFFYRLQTVVNVARASGVKIVVASVPIPTEGHASSAPFVKSYNDAVSRVVQFSGIPYVNLARAYGTTCNYPECDLYNLPEGLHPNTRGYDVMAEAIAATLFQIDIFAADGPAQLESVLGFPAGTVITRPDPAALPPAEQS